MTSSAQEVDTEESPPASATLHVQQTTFCNRKKNKKLYILERSSFRQTFCHLGQFKIQYLVLGAYFPEDFSIPTAEDEDNQQPISLDCLIFLCCGAHLFIAASHDITAVLFFSFYQRTDQLKYLFTEVLWFYKKVE